MTISAEPLVGAGIESLAATAQHIRLLQRKRQTLADALVQAELQYLAALKREYDAGDVSWTQLWMAYGELSAGGIPGYRVRWLAAIPQHPARIATNAKREAAASNGVWTGHRPLQGGEHYPPTDQSVVYVLFDTQNVPIYVGSSGNVSARFAQHHADGKRFAAWIAHGCRDRAEAYEMESRFLRQYMPPLNVQGPQRRGAAAA